MPLLTLRIMNQFLAFTKTIFTNKDNNNYCDGQIVLRLVWLQHTLEFYNIIIYLIL